MMLHVKYLYGIKIDVRGAENFKIKEPYVIVSNHQSSLDLLGMEEERRPDFGDTGTQVGFPLVYQTFDWEFCQVGRLPINVTLLSALHVFI